MNTADLVSWSFNFRLLPITFARLKSTALMVTRVICGVARSWDRDVDVGQRGWLRVRSQRQSKENTGSVSSMRDERPCRLLEIEEEPS